MQSCCQRPSGLPTYSGLCTMRMYVYASADYCQRVSTVVLANVVCIAEHGTCTITHAAAGAVRHTAWASVH